MYLYSINVFRDWIPHAVNLVEFLSINPHGELEDIPIQSPFSLQSKDELLRGINLLLLLDAAIIKSWHKPHDEWIKWIERLKHVFEKKNWKILGIL